MDLEDQEQQQQQYQDRPRTEKTRGLKRNMKSSLCIPRLGARNTAAAAATANNNGSNWLSPISLLERFREAVFRLIMLSAFSKVTHHEESTNCQQRHYCYKYPPDHHHSQAVADCIEFIKKSASTNYETSDSIISNGSSTDNASTEQAVSAWPVM